MKKPKLIALLLSALTLLGAYFWTRTIRGYGDPGTPEDGANVPVVWTNPNLGAYSNR